MGWVEGEGRVGRKGGGWGERGGGKGRGGGGRRGEVGRDGDGGIVGGGCRGGEDFVRTAPPQAQSQAGEVERGGKVKYS